MDALPAAQQRKAVEPDRLHATMHVEGGLLDRVEAELRVRIEVDHEPVGSLDRAGAAAPAMELHTLHPGAGDDLVG